MLKLRIHLTRKFVHMLVVSALALTSSIVYAIAPVHTQSAAAVVNGGTCQGTADATTGYTVTPNHGKVFYIDSGQGQNVDAAYSGYTISKSGTDATTDVWV